MSSSTTPTAMIVWACLLALPVVVSAQSVSAPDVRAAFLLSFARFTEWPAERLAATRPVTLCATDMAVARALTSLAVEQPKIGDHPVLAAHVTVSQAPKQCDVVYASGLKGAQISQATALFERANILSVGDTEEFTRRGGVMRFVVQPNGTLGFAVNVTAAGRARLRLSSRLLGLAIIDRE